MKIVQCKRMEFANRDDAVVIVVVVVFVCAVSGVAGLAFSNLLLHKSEY